MLRIQNLDEIQAMLLRIPALVDVHDRRAPGFIQDVKEWLSRLENILNNNRMPVAGNVATLRGVLISAERGVIPTGVDFYGRPSRRKIREAAAVYVLRQSSDLVSSAIQTDRERVSEAMRMGRQLVALAKIKGLIQKLPSGDNFTDKLKAIWRTLSADPELSPGTVSLEGLVGPYDALVILDQTITNDIPRE